MHCDLWHGVCERALELTPYSKPHNQMKTIATLLSAAVLCASTQAQSAPLLIVLEGTVFQTDPGSPPSGPFTGTQVGEAVRVAFSLETPGQTVGLTSSFFVETERMDLQIGAVSIQGPILPISPFTVGNDVPYPNSGTRDYINSYLALAGVGGLDIRIEDLSGQLLSTSDLAQGLGSYALSGASYIWLQTGPGFQVIFIELTSMDVVQLGPVGSIYCAPPVPNSTGMPAILSGYGSDIASANRLEMNATNLPQKQYSLLLVGSQQAIILNPGNSQGNLCLGGGLIGRFNEQVAYTGSHGTASIQVDLRDMPALFGTVDVMAGQTWNYQLWYRDMNPSSTTNYTNPVEVLFQ